MTENYFSWFFGLCLDCLTLGTNGIYLLYAAIILLAGMMTPTIKAESGSEAGDDKTLMLGDIGGFTLPKLKNGGIISTTYLALMNLLRPSTFVYLTQFFLRFMKLCLGITDNQFDYWAILKRLVVFYFLIIPLPAAFMPPAGYPQAQPDAHLMAAVVMLILINALGDVVSSRITIRNFTKTVDHFSDINVSEPGGRLKQGVALEFQIYKTTLIDLAAALIVLCAVLMISSILFGVQIGAYKFDLDSATLSAMWERALKFYELPFELFWFRDLSGAAAPGTGIPGMFLYGATTFLPTFVMFVSALIWTLTIPMRIVLQLPRSRIQRIFSAELSVFAICIVMTGVTNFGVRDFYSFLITKWTT